MPMWRLSSRAQNSESQSKEAAQQQEPCRSHLGPIAASDRVIWVMIRDLDCSTLCAWNWMCPSHLQQILDIGVTKDATTESFCVHRISSLLSPPIIRSNFAKTSNSTPLWSGSAPQDFEKWIQSSLDGSSQVIGESPVVLVFLITNPETPKWTHRLNAE